MTRIDVELNHNKVKLKDSIWVNPWDEDSDQKEISYLTYKSHTTRDLKLHKEILFDVILTLSDKVKINGRAVYDIITLISEVSGFADLLLVTSTFMMSASLYLVSFLESKILENLGPVLIPRRKKIKHPTLTSQKLTKDVIVSLMKEMRQYQILRLPFYYICLLRCCLRSRRAKKLDKVRK